MIKRKDLVDISDQDWKQRRNEFIQCLDCGVEFGGTRGDFFIIRMDYLLHCPECDSKNLAIVKKVSRNVIVKS